MVTRLWPCSDSHRWYNLRFYLLMWFIYLSRISDIRVQSWCMILMVTDIPCWASQLQPCIPLFGHLSISLCTSPLCSGSSSTLAPADPTSFWAQKLCPQLDHFWYLVLELGWVSQVSQCGGHAEMQLTMLNSWCSSAALHKTWHLYRSWINPVASGMLWAPALCCYQCLSLLGYSREPQLLCECTWHQVEPWTPVWQG